MRQRASVASVAPVVPKKTRVFPRKPGKKNLPKKKKTSPSLSVWSFASPPTSSSLGCFLVTSTPSKRSRKSNMYYKVDRHCDATRVSRKRRARRRTRTFQRREQSGPGRRRVSVMTNRESRNHRQTSWNVGKNCTNHAGRGGGEEARNRVVVAARSKRIVV